MTTHPRFPLSPADPPLLPTPEPSAPARPAFRKAVWIWQRDPAFPDEFCDFTGPVPVPDGDDRRFFLHIACDSNYTVWLNGRLTAFGQYADYPHYKVYDRVDVTEFLSAGHNRIDVTVWYYGAGSSTYAPGEAGLIYEILDADGTVLSCSGEGTLSRLSRLYRSGERRLISGQLGFSFHADLAGSGTDGSGDDGFKNSRAVPSISTEFHPRPNEKLVLKDRLPARILQAGSFTLTSRGDNPAEYMQRAALSWQAPPEAPAGGMVLRGEPIPIRDDRAPEQADGVYLIVDLGEETAGFADLDIETPVPCRLDIGYGEHLDDGRCRTAVRGFSCSVELAAGRNTYLHTFRRFGCRYMQFFIHAPEATVRYAGLRPTLYPFAHTAYESGNPLRETIYRVCQNTLQHCYHEHYEDCPWREQALYGMDSRNQMLCGYFAFREARAARASLELIAQSQRPDGLLSICAPCGSPSLTIPSFTLVYFLQMEEYLRYTGDASLVQRYFDLLARILAAFAEHMTDRGVIRNFSGQAPGGGFDYWNFYEWSDTLSGSFGERESRLEAPLNAFYSLALQAMAAICDRLGKKDRADACRAMAAALNRAIAACFYHADARLFETYDAAFRGRYAVLTQALCLLCGAADSVDPSEMLRAMETNGGQVGDRYVIPNTLSMNIFRFDALLRVDRARYAPLILAEIDRVYLAMLRRGATSFFETAEGADAFGGVGSLCHGWSALPAYYYSILDGR